MSPARQILKAVFTPQLPSNTFKSLRRSAVLGVLIFTVFSACNVLDSDEPAPNYVHITEFELFTPSNNTQGSNSHDVRDVWVDVQGADVGVFEVPATFPVLLTQDINQMILQAGIKNNGRANNRIRYPFYTILTDSLEKSNTGIDTIRPIIKYVDNITFPWLEDLEDRSISLEVEGIDVTIDTITLTNDSSEVFEFDSHNQYSAKIDMGIGEQYFEARSIPTFDFPRGRPIYLELNYKTDVSVQVGLVALEGNIVQDQIPVLLLFPSDSKWKKVYISLGEDVNTQDYANMTFKVFFAARNDGSTDNPSILLDNIKVLHL